MNLHYEILISILFGKIIKQLKEVKSIIPFIKCEHFKINCNVFSSTIKFFYKQVKLNQVIK